MASVGPVTFYYKNIKTLSVGSVDIEYKTEITKHNEDEFNRQIGIRMRYFFVLTLLRDHFDLFNSILTDSISDMTEDTEEGLKIIDKFYDWFENDYNTNVRDLPTGNKNEALFAFNDESTSNNVMENLMENISFTFK